MTRARRHRGQPPVRRSRRHAVQGGSRAGFALMMAMITVAILAVLVTEFHSNTGTAFAAANMQRDRLKAEYLARSGVNLTRMLMSQERTLRTLVDPFYKMMGIGSAPQIPVWEYADFMLKPFADFEGSEEALGGAGYDLGLAEGLGELDGTFEVLGSAENTKLNVNRHLTQTEAEMKQRIGTELFTRFGGLASPSPYDPLFSELDDQGRMVTNADLVSNIIDWWDSDQTRSQYDPGALQVVDAGGEDNSYYQRQKPPYEIKNAPFDTYEELHLVHGISDDIWATFVDPDPNDPRERQFTIYGGGAVNPNGAKPLAVLAALCDSEMSDVPLCNDPAQSLRFATVLSTLNMMTMNAPVFSDQESFLQFMEHKGTLFGMVAPMLAMMPELQFEPVVFTDQKKRDAVKGKLVMQGEIVTVQVTAYVGRARKRLRVVLNTHGRWVGPPGTTGTQGPLGILHYFRFD